MVVARIRRGAWRPSRRAVALAVLLGACSPVAGPPAAAVHPDVVLVSIDTLRADRVTPTLTPAIEKLASAGARFTMARTVAPLTLPAHVSLMTGVRPPTHGVHLNGTDRFAGHVPTLATLLANAGYRTGAFVGAYVLDRRFGLDGGFEVYDDQVPRRPEASMRLESERRGAVVIDRALAWLSEADREPARPIFLWVHLYDPHAPYDPPPEFLDKGGGQPYDGEVAYADRQIERLLNGLALSGDRVRVIAVVSDHGESLGEHGETTHGMLLYDGALRVPLVIAGRGVPAATHRDAVTILDVAPTLLAAAGVGTPSTMEGRNLLGAPGLASPAVYAETDYPRLAGWSALAALTDGHWKLIDAPDPELYDLAGDTVEGTNVAADHAGIVAAMQRRVRELGTRASSAPPAAPVAPEVAERLRALGYVAGGTTPTVRDGPNPATMMTAWNAFEGVLADLAADRLPAAIASLRRLADEHPESPLFQSTLARTLSDAGNHQAALGVYRRAVARWPDDSLLYHDLGVSAREAGLRDEALRAEEAALAIDPDNALAHNGRGLLLAEAGRARDARLAFARAAALDPTNIGFLVHLGNAEQESGDRTAAEQAYRRALDIDGDAGDALNGLAVVLVQAGRPQEAVPLLERALARDPQFIDARLNLGIALQESGDWERAGAAYREVLRAPARFREQRAAAAALLQGVERRSPRR